MKSSLATVCLLICSTIALCAAPTFPPGPGDAIINQYFQTETAAITRRCLADIRTLDDWTSRREEYRRQLAQMLGLYPPPPRGDLKATITGRIEHPEFFVEKLHFQSMPEFYVTANLYIPRNLTQRAPAILYVCGHGNVVKDGVSYGAKAWFQHHPAWFARNGYVCLIIDTVQLGEIQGLHHGTYREGMWWWHSRGYTPAGVEAWNGIRAIDYLQSRPEVDPNRIGLTGRSGGGAYTWWIAALDERVKAAVPVAGITDLQNHVVDGSIEEHCDCMFMVNMYRWDFAQVAALVAPRPLLIANTDKDSMFPLDGVVRLHSQTRRIYQLYKADDKLGLLITEGPHKDTQDLQVPAFRWFNRFLKNDDAPVEKVATKFFTPEQLKVFPQLPADSINARIQEYFVPAASSPRITADRPAFDQQRDAWMSALRSQVFAGWPVTPPPLDLKPAFSAQRNGIRLRAYDYTIQESMRLRLYLLDRPNTDPARELVVDILDDETWTKLQPALEPSSTVSLALPEGAMLACVAPRGIGPTAWSADPRRRTHILRRFALLGQTLDGMRVWDVRRATQALRTLPEMKNVPIQYRARAAMAGIAVYASLFEDRISTLDLYDLPPSHAEGPYLLNVMKYLDMPAAVAMAADRARIRIHQAKANGWEYPTAVLQRLGRRSQLEVIPTDQP